MKKIIFFFGVLTVLGTVAQAQVNTFFRKNKNQYHATGNYHNNRFSNVRQYGNRYYGMRNYGGYGYNGVNAAIGLNSNFTGYDNGGYYGPNYGYQQPYYIDYYDDYNRPCQAYCSGVSIPVGVVLVVGTTNHYYYRHHRRFY